MKNKRKQSGFILIVAVSLIPLVAVGIWVLTRNTHYLIRETQTQRLQTEARNIVCSAQAWADLNKDQILSAPQEQTWTLDPEPLQIPRGSCRLSILSRSPDGCTLQIAAVAQSGDKSWTEKRTMTLSR
jgi:hypothetical protein